MLKRAANVNMTYVPYPGAAPAVNALLGEHLTSALVDYAGVAEQLKAGKLRALATGSRTRIELLPGVPTASESGYTDYEAELWIGVVAPAKTPKETVSQLAGWFTSGDAGGRGQGEACRAGVHSGRDVWCGFRRLYSQAI